MMYKNFILLSQSQNEEAFLFFTKTTFCKLEFELGNFISSSIATAGVAMDTKMLHLPIGNKS